MNQSLCKDRGQTVVSTEQPDLRFVESLFIATEFPVPLSVSLSPEMELFPDIRRSLHQNGSPCTHSVKLYCLAT